MRNALKSNEWHRLWVFKTFKIEIQNGNQIIQTLCRIVSCQEIRSPLFNLGIFKKSKKSTLESCRMHWNLMNDKEFGSLKLLKLKYRRGDQIIQSFFRIGSLQEIRSPHLNLWKFEKSEKSTSGLCRMHEKLMNDEELKSFNFLKLKYRRVDQIPQLFVTNFQKFLMNSLTPPASY